MPPEGPHQEFAVTGPLSLDPPERTHSKGPAFHVDIQPDQAEAPLLDGVDGKEVTVHDGTFGGGGPTVCRLDGARCDAPEARTVFVR